MRLVLGDDATVAEWVSARLGIRLIPPFVAFGIVDGEGMLSGAIVFNGYNHFNIEATVFGTACAQRRFLRAAMHYVFVQLKCLRLTCRTKRSNKTVARQLARLGFIYEGTMKSYFGPERGDDAIVYAIFPPQAARWIGD